MLGKGQFGTTRLVTDKKTGEQLACKSISKRKLTTPEDIEDVQREVSDGCCCFVVCWRVRAARAAAGVGAVLTKRY